MTGGTERSLDEREVWAPNGDAVDETPPARPDHRPLHAEPHESPVHARLREAHALPLLRTVPVVALAVLSVLGTLFLLTLAGGIHVGWLSALVSVLLIAGAAAGVWVASRRGQRDAAELVPDHVRTGAVAGYGADTAYAAFGRAVVALARLVVVLDRDVVDAYPRAFAATTHAAGRAGMRSHRAVPSVALIGVVAGVIVVAVLGVTAWR